MSMSISEMRLMERRLEDAWRRVARAEAERNELLKRCDAFMSNAAEWKSKAREYDALFTQENARAVAAEERLASIIGYCAQEGHDGEPWDTIKAIATGEHDPCGSRPAGSASGGQS